MVRDFSNSVARKLGRRRGRIRDWRRDFRLRVELPAEINGVSCSLEDVSISGARVALQKAVAPRIGDPVRLSFTLSGSGYSVHGVVIREADDGLMSELGIAFAGEQPDAVAFLAGAIDDLRSAAS